MNKPIIGITTDIDSEYIKLKHGYCKAVKLAGGIPVLLPARGDAEAYQKMIHGLLIPGGDDLAPSYYGEDMMPKVNPVLKERSDFEMSLFRKVLQLRKPILGICYGMQLINVALGGALYQDIDSDVTLDISHKKDYHLIVITENMFVKKGTFSVNSTHHQAVKKLGSGLSAFAYSEDRLIEAFYGKDCNFLVGVQWHPERLMENELSLNLFKSFIEAAKASNDSE